MFSGIIEKLARVESVEQENKTLSLVLDTGYHDLDLGESIAVNGVCLTVTEMNGDGAARFFVSPETLERSNLGELAVRDLVNLERSVRLESRLSGHLVQGHVDGKANLVSVNPKGGAYLLELALPDELGRYCVEKGSIALNGISLTLNAVIRDESQQFRIGLTIIPHTWEHTNLHSIGIGGEINVEVDVIAKYVERICQPYLKP